MQKSLPAFQWDMTFLGKYFRGRKMNIHRKGRYWAQRKISGKKPKTYRRGAETQRKDAGKDRNS
jgi:hypothetical protein